MARIDELFSIEAQAPDHSLSQEERQLARLQKSGPVLEQIKSQVQRARTDALPKSVLAKAYNYTLSLWTRLNRFMEHPQLELSNNLAENAMRPVALGRRNWVRIGSEQAGPRVAAIVSVIEPAAGSKSRSGIIFVRLCRVWQTSRSIASRSLRPLPG